MNGRLDPELIEELRRMRKLGASPFDLLKHIKKKHPENIYIVFPCMKYFRDAFGLSIKQASPIGGWDSGELSDLEVDAFLNEEMPRP